jgi:hypothetical protein
MMSLDYTQGDIPRALWNLVLEAAADFPQTHFAFLALLTEAKNNESEHFGHENNNNNQPRTLGA